MNTKALRVIGEALTVVVNLKVRLEVLLCMLEELLDVSFVLLQMKGNLALSALLSALETAHAGFKFQPRRTRHHHTAERRQRHLVTLGVAQLPVQPLLERATIPLQHVALLVQVVALIGVQLRFIMR